MNGTALKENTERSIIPYAVQLYSVNDFDLSNIDKSDVEKLIGIELNGIPILGSFCKKKSVLMDLKLYTDFAAITFCFENEKIVIKDAVPYLSLRKNHLKCRYYFKYGLAFLDITEDEDMYTAVRILNALESYFTLEKSPGLEFNLQLNKASPYELDERKILMLAEFWDERLLIKRDKDLKNDIICVKDINEVSDDIEIEMKHKMLKGKNKAILFYGHGINENMQKVTIFSNGVINSALYVDYISAQQFEKFLCIIKTENNIKYVKPIEKTLNDHMDSIHSGMHFDARKRNIKLIFEELSQFAYRAHDKAFKADIVYITIMFNILRELILKQRMEKEIPGEYEDFTALEDFLYAYGKHESGKAMDGNTFNSIMGTLEDMLVSSQGSEFKLLESADKAFAIT